MVALCDATPSVGVHWGTPSATWPLDASQDDVDMERRPLDAPSANSGAREAAVEMVETEFVNGDQPLLQTGPATKIVLCAPLVLASHLRGEEAMVGTRGTTPREEVPAVPGDERGTANFKVIWAGFKAAGWTAKPPPRGIGTLWKYVLPGRDDNVAEGADYLLGEQAVLNYAIRMARQEVDDTTSSGMDNATKSPRSIKKPVRKSCKSSKGSSRSTPASLPSASAPPVPPSGSIVHHGLLISDPAATAKRTDQHSARLVESDETVAAKAKQANSASH
ncbi:hypothetical protein ON010_g5669 [Phytophthora cinnamomi]|nr:hypothetical protein ON010_g5669 [Phytophthora cinnamomi]